MAAVERFDKFANLRNSLRGIANGIGEWAGLPMPLDDMALVVEPNFPNADFFASFGRKTAEAAEDDGTRIRNTFWSWHRRAEIVVMEKGGKIEWGPVGRGHHVDQLLQTLGASVAWGIEQEQKALQLLGSMLRHHAFKQYLMTGMFLETSPRSGVTYLFRKLRPTLALSLKGEQIKILCALCLHPIAYYQGSWAGAMCPTDDVIAHLALMRGDEHMLWRRANQHPAWRPEAGV